MTDRRLAAIMFTDIVGYSSLMSDDEQLALAVVERQRQLLQPLVLQHGGQWLKEMGDGTLSSFSSATNAVQCAIDIQNSLREMSDFKIRIGIHLGDIVFTDVDVLGDGVNIAARIEPMAAPGGICISGAVYDALSHNKHFETELLGEKVLKNLSRPVRVFSIRNDQLPAGEPWTTAESGEQKSGSTGSPFSARKLLPAVAIAAVVIGTFLYTTVFDLPEEPSEIAVNSASPTLAPINSTPVLEAEQAAPEPSLDVDTDDVDDSPSDDEPVDAAPAALTDSSRPEAPVVDSEPIFVANQQTGPLVANPPIPVEQTAADDRTNERSAPVLESALPEPETGTDPAPPTDREPGALVDKSIAVLPFANLSADPNNVYFAAGVHEEVLGQLAKVADLRVISRRSVLQYEDSTESITDIAGELGVATIMEGSVRFAGNRVRITCNLIDVRSDTQIWSETYERELEDIFAIQADVAIQVANSMQATMQPSEVSRIETAPTRNSQAYTLYLQTLYRVEQNQYAMTDGPGSWLQRSISDLERAIELDPEFAGAYAQLAALQAFTGFAGVFSSNPGESSNPAINNANRAIELDPNQSKAYGVLATDAIANRRWREFLAHADLILALPDIETTTYSDLALGFAVLGRYDKSRELIEAAVQSDPNSSVMRWIAMVIATASRDYERVLELSEQYRALGGDINSYHLYRATALEFLERSSEADIELAEINGDLTQQDFGFYPFYSYLNCKRGRQMEMMQFAMQQTLFNLTLANVGCRLATNDLDGVFETVQALMVTGTVFPDFGELFDGLRADPRWAMIESYNGLPD